MKRILVVLLAAFLLCGCQKKKDDVILIGAILPLTGAGAEAGISVKNAMELYIEKWNKQNDNNKLEGVYLDSKAEPKEGKILANEIVTRYNPKMVISGVSGVTINAQPILEQRGIIHVGLVSTNIILNETAKYTLRCYTIPSDICGYVTDEIKETLKRNSYTLFYANTEFALSFKNQFELCNKTTDLNMKSFCYNENELSYRDLIRKANLDPNEVIYISGQYQALGRIIRQIRESGHNGIIISDAHMNSNTVLNLLGNTSNLYYVNVNKNDKTEMLMKEYFETYGTMMSDFALLAYNAMDVVLSNVRQNPNIDNELIMQNLQDYLYEGTIGKSMVKDRDIKVEFTLKAL